MCIAQLGNVYSGWTENVMLNECVCHNKERGSKKCTIFKRKSIDSVSMGRRRSIRRRKKRYANFLLPSFVSFVVPFFFIFCLMWHSFIIMYIYFNGRCNKQKEQINKQAKKNERWMLWESHATVVHSKTEKFVDCWILGK